MKVPVYLRTLRKHAGQGPGWSKRVCVGRAGATAAHASMGQGVISPCHVLGQAAAASEHEVLWCAHMQFFWMLRGAPEVPART